MMLEIVRDSFTEAAAANTSAAANHLNSNLTNAGAGVSSQHEKCSTSSYAVAGDLSPLDAAKDEHDDLANNFSPESPRSDFSEGLNSATAPSVRMDTKAADALKYVSSFVSSGSGKRTVKETTNSSRYAVKVLTVGDISAISHN